MSLFADFQVKDANLPPLDASTGLKIREAEESDLAALAMIAAQREGTTQDVQRRLFERQLSQQRGTGQFMILVADVQGKVVGFGKCDCFTPPENAPANVAPKGWYLMGVIVIPTFRRRRVAYQLTKARLQWLAGHTSKAYYFANALNQVSIELHQKFGFVEVTRHFFFPNITFAGGTGILFEVDLNTMERLPKKQAE
jgi:ribosomal protein S18 acetylase RimI-like enzyme